MVLQFKIENPTEDKIITGLFGKFNSKLNFSPCQTGVSSKEMLEYMENFTGKFGVIRIQIPVELKNCEKQYQEPFILENKNKSREIKKIIPPPPKGELMNSFLIGDVIEGFSITKNNHIKYKIHPKSYVIITVFPEFKSKQNV